MNNEDSFYNMDLLPSITKWSFYWNPFPFDLQAIKKVDYVFHGTIGIGKLISTPNNKGRWSRQQLIWISPQPASSPISYISSIFLHPDPLQKVAK